MTDIHFDILPEEKIEFEDILSYFSCKTLMWYMFFVSFSSLTN